MSAEQGDVVTWVEEAQKALHALLYVRLPKEQKVTAHDVVWVALDRLTAALERAEREPNRRRAADDALEAQTLATDLAGALARAEKAELALAEAEMALMEIRNAAEAGGPGEMPARWFAERARAALRPSEDTSDES